MAEAKPAFYERALKVAVSLLLLKMSFDLHSQVNLAANLPGALASLTFTALSLTLLVEALSNLDLARAKWPMAAASLIFIAASALPSSPTAPRLGSDAALFTRYAVDLLLSGRNPYSCSMQPALTLYSVDYAWVTQTMDGGMVSTYSYPALSFLVYVPAALLGVVDVGLVMVSFFALVAVLLIFETPKEYRLIPLLVLLLDPSLAAFSYGGAHDIIWVFFLLLSMKFFNPRSRRELRLSAALLGLSMAVKQMPWLILPFTAIWVFKEAGRREALAYLGVAAASFLAPNLAFILWSPLDWLRGVLTPIAQPLIPMGVGLVSLVYEGYVYLPRSFFTVATAVAAALALALYWVNFEKLKPLAWIAPPLILFFAWRSLYNYFLFFIPVAYYAALLKVRGRV